MSRNSLPAILWADVATAMDQHIGEGRGHLLTEDFLRFETVLVAQRLGIDPGEMAFEWRAEGVPGSFDLAIGNPPHAVVEFK